MVFIFRNGSHAITSLEPTKCFAKIYAIKLLSLAETIQSYFDPFLLFVRTAKSYCRTFLLYFFRDLDVYLEEFPVARVSDLLEEDWASSGFICHSLQCYHCLLFLFFPFTDLLLRQFFMDTAKGGDQGRGSLDPLC